MLRFERIGLVVSDLVRAIDLYRRLGFDFPDVAPDELHAEASGPGGLRVIFDTDSAMRAYSDWQPATGGDPRSALKFACDSPEDVDRSFDELVEAGWSPHLPPFDAHWDERYATLHDPDGNAIDLFATL